MLKFLGLFFSGRRIAANEIKDSIFASSEMRTRSTYKLIAATLLVVFSLNPILGFACSIGIDMGYNSNHHHTAQKDHCKQSADKPENKKDCCKDQVYQFQKLDKSIPDAINLAHPSFLSSYTEFFYSISLPSDFFVKEVKQFVRSYHPPIPDIRIAIQSFQV